MEADSLVVFSGMLKPGEAQTVTAKERIKVISENTARTFVRFNGLPEASLGNGQIAGQAVIFTSAGRQE